MDCGKVRPESGCGNVIQAESEEEFMRRVAEHAKTHTLEPPPELVAEVKRHIQRT